MWRPHERDFTANFNLFLTFGGSINHVAMEWIHKILDFLHLLAITTLYQLLSLLGLLFVVGLILYFLARFTRNAFAAASARKLDVFVTGWICTPVHELSHALFCLVFGHRITDIKLFRPNSSDGSLGYVKHTYNSKNIYHRIGNLFIGAGPVILGALALYGLIHLLLPNTASLGIIKTANGLQVTHVKDLGMHWQSILSTAQTMLEQLFRAENFSQVSFWIFLYISASIASHMELSPADLKGMMKGLLSLTLLLLVLNTIALLMKQDIRTYIFIAGSYFGLFFGIYLYATLISLLNFTASFVLLSAYSWIRFHRFINPFQ